MKVKLKDIINEVNERTTQNNQYPILTSSQNGIFLQEEYFKKNVASKNNIGYKIIRKGEFTYRSMSDTGNFTINRLENIDIGIVSPAYPVFKCNGVNPDYLKYYFSSNNFKRQIDNLYQGGTRVALKLKDLENIEIEIPTEDKQTEIVKLLKNLDNLISRYEKAVKEKEQFIKSQFVEMLKRSKLKEYKLSKIAKYWNGQTYKPTDINDQGMIVLRSSNIQNNELDFNDIVRINNDIKSKNIVKENDILMCSRNGSANLVGKVAIIKNIPEKMCFGTFMMIIRSNYYKFLYYYFQSKEFRKNISVETTTQINQITVNMLDKVVVKIPENNEMEKFILIEELIDKQKFFSQFVVKEEKMYA